MLRSDRSRPGAGQIRATCRSCNLPQVRPRVDPAAMSVGEGHVQSKISHRRDLGNHDIGNRNIVDLPGKVTVKARPHARSAFAGSTQPPGRQDNVGLVRPGQPQLRAAGADLDLFGRRHSRRRQRGWGREVGHRQHTPARNRASNGGQPQQLVATRDVGRWRVEPGAGYPNVWSHHVKAFAPGSRMFVARAIVNGKLTTNCYRPSREC